MDLNLIFVTNKNDNMLNLTEGILARKFKVKTIDFDLCQLISLQQDIEKDINESIDCVVINTKNMNNNQYNAFMENKEGLLDVNTPLIIIGPVEDKYNYNDLKKIPNAKDMSGKKLTEVSEELSKLYEIIKVKKETLLKIQLEKEANRRRKIMLVDDDALVLRSMNNLLKSKYDIIMAPSGMLALNLLSKCNPKPDLILLDYCMPGLDGSQTLEKIRKIKEYSNIPVFFLTGVNDKNMIMHAMGLKPQGYLLKNMGKEEIIEKIDGYLKIKR